MQGAVSTWIPDQRRKRLVRDDTSEMNVGPGKFALSVNCAKAN